MPATYLCFYGVFLLMEIIGGYTIVKTYQSTTWNNYESGLAVDADLGTCATTGYDLVPRWSVVLDRVYNISAVTLTGQELPNVRISVTADDTDNGKVCATWLEGPVPIKNGYRFSCGEKDLPAGSIVGVSTHVDNTDGTRLILCDIQIETA